MCGITGIFAFNQIGRLNMINLRKATEILESRGPDDQGMFNDEFVGLGHRRLSIIDTSYAGHQPMSDPLQKYQIAYNGEIYNFRELRSDLERKGITFNSATDTEVLLYLFIVHGEKCLDLINGFFAFAIYDREKQELFVARDRFGIKPLYYFQDQDKFIFASEMKSLLSYGIPREINRTALSLYFQLNYIPHPYSILHGVQKLAPGHFAKVTFDHVEVKKYYRPDPDYLSDEFDKKDVIGNFKTLLEESVRKRMVSDVPLGAFLSGGLDSSVISMLASRNTENLHTYSIGFRDDKFFDETKHAEKVAKHCNTSHTTFMLTGRDLYEKVFDVLNYIDEPFADSSAIAVNILSHETRKHVTVALSGDGADELLAGYNKHRALYRSLQPGFLENSVQAFGPLWNLLPKSRSNFLSNSIRQFDRFAKASKLNEQQRYWMLASFLDKPFVDKLLTPEFLHPETLARDDLNSMYEFESKHKDVINQHLGMDQRLVLPNDMLYKVDLMSMSNSLEVRVPFLDHLLVEYVNTLPSSLKINSNQGKLLLREAYKKELPSSILKRRKHGFEVPLLSWFRKEMKALILDDLLSEEYIYDQGIFEPKAVRRLLRKLYSINPGDTHATIWALIVFQCWYKKYFLH